MEREHRDILKERFTIAGKAVVVLDIEDNYRFNDPELIELLKGYLSEYL
jgi:predicted protein tyrosine phosphatase